MIKRTNWAGEKGIAENNKKSSLRYEILPQKIRYRRDILFGFEDLIVSFGGTAALFLGYNFWNTSEMLYYIVNTTTKYFLQTFYERNVPSSPPNLSRIQGKIKL